MNLAAIETVLNSTVDTSNFTMSSETILKDGIVEVSYNKLDRYYYITCHSNKQEDLTNFVNEIKASKFAGRIKKIEIDSIEYPRIKNNLGKWVEDKTKPCLPMLASIKIK